MINLPFSNTHIFVWTLSILSATQNVTLVIKSFENWMEGKFFVVDINKTLIYPSKHRVEASPQVNYNGLFCRKKSYSLSYYVLKVAKSVHNIDFRFVKV